ncbi:MAG TPA: hypothetical protein VL860_14900, partial [Planctomycetota bacterium]|nr:hypothetical protein [Planctomycetota bacterium]
MQRIATVVGLALRVGLFLWAGLPLRAAETPPAENLKFAASGSADWRLDSLTNYLHLKNLCESNLRHADQELAALAAPAGKKDAGDFPLQKLLQGEGATIDLTQPYQVHVTADVIEPAQSQTPATQAVSAGASDAAPHPVTPTPQYIRARKFHLRQKVASSDKPGAATTFMTLNAALADFGIVAGATNEPTGAQRVMGQTGNGPHAGTEQLSWPFVADLQNQVDVRYARAPNGGPAAPIPPTGVMGDLSGLVITANRMHALLAGDNRAGRSLFWAPPVETPAAGPAQGAKPALARLEAAFDGGVSLLVEARSLEVELAWNALTGETEIRWAGAGQVRLLLSGLRRDGKPGSAQQSSEQWELGADAFSLISLAGQEDGDAASDETNSATADRSAWPTRLPTASTPTFLLTVQGRAKIVQRSLAAGIAPHAEPFNAADAGSATGEPTRPDGTGEQTFFVAWFDQGLFELERTMREPGIATEPPGTGTKPATPKSSEPVLQRAWLRAGGLGHSDDAALRLL